MKNPLKRIVPLILAIAVVAGAAWYLLEYDRDFARDMLLSQARYFEKTGNLQASTWLYDQAYRFSDDDELVAIELAEQYKSSGNYTKAEYTLSKAIADDPSMELYIALCKTYVEQDKLLDAVNLLDKISDPIIKQELDAMRPAVPTVSQAPGFYSQYIKVDVISNATLYVTADGEYPSVAEDFYAGTISLPEGETTIYSLAIGDNGLVSPLGLYGYTIGGVIEPLEFADPVIEAEVRSLLGLTDDAVIYTNDLWSITEFTVPAYAKTYDDIGKMTFLTSLTIQNAVSVELESISNLTQLENLFISGSVVNGKTLNAIASLPKLTELTLAHCNISNIAPLSNARNLRYLDLNYNSVGDLSALNGMTELETLYLAHNAVTDLTPLSGLRKLTKLDVSYNSLTSVAPICTCISLQELNVSHNLLSHLSAMDHLTQLTSLDANYNKLNTVEVLGNCAKLSYLNISNNQLSSIASIGTLGSLREFDFSYNTVTSLPNWTEKNAIVILNGAYNRLNDLTPLAKLQKLNRLNLDYNSDIASVEPLVGCFNLMEVNLFGTAVRDVEALTQQDIIVHYNPTQTDVVITEPTVTP